MFENPLEIDMAAVAYPLSFPNRRPSRAERNHAGLRLVTAFDQTDHPQLERPATGAVVRQMRVAPVVPAVRQIPMARPMPLPAFDLVEVPAFEEFVVPRTRHVRSRAAVQARRKAVARRRFLVGTIGTLSVFAALWFATGAMVAGRSGTIDRLAGSVPDGGSFVYTARPGDTLWSIATRLDPSGDPRPIVNMLNAQLHGGNLQAGTKLIVP